MASLSFIKSAKLIELLKRADSNGKMSVRVLNGDSRDRLAIGLDPFSPTLVLDLSKETVSSYPDGPQINMVASIELPEQPIASPPTERRSGFYRYEIKGRHYQCKSLKELLRMSFESIEHLSPGTLERLSHIKPRSKRIVARDPEMLFESPNLAEKYSEKLPSGWWIGTNNSTPETKAWLQRAVRCAGLRWGSDFSTDI